MARTGTLRRHPALHVVPDGTTSIGPAVPLIPVEALLAELLAARQIIEDARSQHCVTGLNSGRPWCRDDGRAWPCPTTRALDGGFAHHDDVA